MPIRTPEPKQDEEQRSKPKNIKGNKTAPTLPEKFYRLATLYTVSGAALGVWVITSVAGRFGLASAADIVALVVALVIAIGLYVIQPEKFPWWNPLHMVLVCINAALIFLHAAGFNTATHAVPSSPAGRAVKQSLLPSFDTVPWFPPADQRIAAEELARATKSALVSSVAVREQLSDLSAGVRRERLTVEQRLREARPALEQAQRVERAALEQRLREARARLEEELGRQTADRQRLERTLSGTVHPAERPSLEKRLAEVQQAEDRARAELAAADSRAQAERRALETKQQQSLAALGADEMRMNADIAALMSREQRLRELQKDAAPVLQAATANMAIAAQRLEESVARLDRAYQGIRGYNPDRAAP